MSRFNSYCLCYFLFQHNYSTFFYKNYVFYLNIYIQIKFRTKTIKNHELFLKLHSVQFSCSLVDNFLRPHGLQHARLPCPYQFPELAKTHVHWVGDAIQPPHPQSSPSPAFNLAQHQGLFQWVNSSHQVAKVLEFQLQHQSFQWVFRISL